MIFSLVKPSDGSMTGRLNLSSPQQKNDHPSAIAADHISATGRNIKWYHFEILDLAKQIIIVR